MIACILGLTACGGDEQLTEYEQKKVETAVILAENRVIPAVQDVLDTPSAAILREYTAEEVEYRVWENYELTMDGNAFMSAVDSFAAAYEDIGGYGEITGSGAEISDRQIIVRVDIAGPDQDAQAEIIFSNDFFFEVESASLSKVSTMGDSMIKAAQNTLLGMCSVFAVLILISLIISCFNFIPKIQEKLSGKKNVKETTAATAVAAGAQETAEETDDLELVAVIAAAIAASEGAVSTDGFVVRSIKRRRAY